ncbi:MAG: hypothetical protein C0501_31740 [Isosphaera sp.]|nr:hypothetical protein [Isosphaera sp.]
MTPGVADDLSAEERQLLAECSRRQQEIAARKSPPKWQAWAVRDWEDAREYGPRYLPSGWFTGGRELLPEKFRVRFLRAVRGLAARGLLTPTRTGNRLTHVKLTAEGQRVAAELAPDG